MLVTLCISINKEHFYNTLGLVLES